MSETNGKKKLPLTDKKDILTRCIYGVDIDVHAVEVSKFSLLIKLIEDETPASVKECVPILPDLSSNIKNGNSLICREDISGKDMSIEALCNIKPFEWSMINSGSRFDAIIGNPPYVKTEDIHTLETEAEFAVYKKKYKSAYKQFDKYFLFLEEAFNLLKENGQIVCLIKPQFEAGRENVGKKGVVRDKKVHVQVIEKVIEYAMSIGFKILNLDYSPVKGPEGNIEYLLYLQNNGEEPVVDEICVDPVKVVEDSHVTLDKKKQENS